MNRINGIVLFSVSFALCLAASTAFAQDGEVYFEQEWAEEVYETDDGTLVESYDEVYVEESDEGSLTVESTEAVVSDGDITAESREDTYVEETLDGAIITNVRQDTITDEITGEVYEEIVEEVYVEE